MRNYSIDTLKCLCAVLVVFLHTNCMYSDWIKPITRCAVPCFFMISGLFIYDSDFFKSEARIKRSLKKIFWIFIWSTLLFAVVKEGVNLIQGRGFFIPTLSELYNFMLFNANPFGGHLWYISAYIYVLLIVYVINKYRFWNGLFYIFPFLLITDLVFGKYSLVFFGREFSFLYLRNFLFVGLPYFAIGAWISAKSIHIKRTYKLILGGGDFWHHISCRT